MNDLFWLAMTVLHGAGMYFLGRRHGMEAVLARLERKLERAA